MQDSDAHPGATVHLMQSDAQSLLDADRHASNLGVRLVSAEPGSVVVEMVVNEHHLNFLDLAHGGTVFSLADIAFSLIANAEQSTAVAVDASISLVRGARRDDTLYARATIDRSTRSMGWYRVEVENQIGELVARFNGTGYRAPSH